MKKARLHMTKELPAFAQQSNTTRLASPSVAHFAQSFACKKEMTKIHRLFKESKSQGPPLTIGCFHVF